MAHNFIREPCMDCFRKDRKIEELQDEIERLKADMARQQKVYHETQWHQLQGARAANERLRAALQDIIDQGETVCLWDAQQIARAALEAKP